MKLYAVRVEMTRWADVHVVAESEDAAIDLALDRARDILDDCDAEDEAEASADEARGGWTPGELPYLTDEAAEVEVELCRIPRGGDATCDQWAEALKGAAPVAKPKRAAKAPPARNVPVPEADDLAVYGERSVVAIIHEGGPWELVWSDALPGHMSYEVAVSATTAQAHRVRVYHRGKRCTRDSRDGAQ